MHIRFCAIIRSIFCVCRNFPQSYKLQLSSKNFKWNWVYLCSQPSDISQKAITSPDRTGGKVYYQSESRTDCITITSPGGNVLLDFDLTVSIVHPMGGGLQLVFFGYPSYRGIRKGQSCSSTLLLYYGTANYMLPLEMHINQGYPLWFVAISGHINTQINSNRVNYTGILECIVNHSKKTC